MRRRLVIAAGLLALLLVLNHYAPLQPGSTCFWGSVLLAIVGLVSLMKPLRWLDVPTRKRALAVCAVGVAGAVITLLWPPHTVAAGNTGQRLDRYLPAYECVERHETRVHASPERVAKAVREVRMSDIPAAGALMALRTLSSGRLRAEPPGNERPLLETMERPGSNFLALEKDTPGEFIGGMLGRPWRNERPPDVRDAAGFLAYRDPDAVKVAFNIRWQADGDGWTTLTTETRVAGTDEAGRRIFVRYWRVIYPGSAIIRRTWLDTIAHMAERPQ